MKQNKQRGFTPILLVIAVVVVIGLAAIAWYSFKGTSSTAPTLQANKQPLPTLSPLPPVDQNFPEATVTITDAGFIPKTILVRKNQRVTWVNQTSKSHQLAADQKSDKTSAETLNGTAALNAKDSMTLSFLTTGSITYHDVTDQAMVGSIIVQ